MIKNIFFAFVLPLSFSFNTIQQPEQASFDSSPTRNSANHIATSSRYKVKYVDKDKRVELNGRQLRIGVSVSEGDIASIQMEKDAYFALLNRDEPETEYYTAGGDCSEDLCSPRLVGIEKQGGSKIVKTGTKLQFEHLLAKVKAAMSVSDNE